MTTKKQLLAQINKATRLAQKHSEASAKAYQMLEDIVGEDRARAISENDEYSFVDATDYGIAGMTEQELDELLEKGGLENGY